VVRFIGNVLWLVLAGFWLAVAYFIAGLLNFVFIVTIPFGIQAFKLAGYSLWPFGRTVVARPGGGGAVPFIGNVIWFLISGLWLAIAHIMTGVLLCLTIIGIPLGVANFKLAGLAIAPFGKQIVRVDDLHPATIPQLH